MGFVGVCRLAVGVPEARSSSVVYLVLSYSMLILRSAISSGTHNSMTAG